MLQRRYLTAFALVFGLVLTTAPAALAQSHFNAQGSVGSANRDAEGSWLTATREARAAIKRADWDEARENADWAMRLVEGDGLDHRRITTLDLAIQIEQRVRNREAIADLQLAKLEWLDGQADLLGRSRSRFDLASTFSQMQRHPEAESLLRDALTLREGLADERYPRISDLLGALARSVDEQRPGDAEAGDLLSRRADLDGSSASRLEAARWYARNDQLDVAILQAQRAIDDETARVEPRTRLSYLLQSMANWAEQANDLVGAEQALRGAVEARREELGSRHPSVAHDLKGLARFLVRHDRLEDAVEPLIEADALTQAAWGEAVSQCTCEARRMLADVYRKLGDDGSADALAVPEFVQDNSPFARQMRDRYAQVRKLRTGLKEREALQLAQETVSLQQSQESIDAPALLEGMRLVVSIQEQLGDYDGMRDTLFEAETVLGGLEAPAPGWQAWIASSRARSYDRSCGYDEAVVHGREAVREYIAAGVPIEVARAQSALGASLGLAQDSGRAAAAFLESADTWESFAGIDAQGRRVARLQASSHLRKVEQFAEAEAVLVDLLELEDDFGRPRPTVLLSILRPLEQVYRATGNLDALETVRSRIADIEALE